MQPAPYPHAEFPRLGGVNELVITKLLLTEVGTFNDMYVRPYQSQMTRQSIDAFQEATEYGKVINASVLAGVAGDMLRPVAQHQGMTTIANGWDGRRFRFLMEVTQGSQFAGSGQLRQIIGGYTNHLGATHSGAIDPEMQFFFNSVMVVRDTLTPGPNGNYYTTSVSDVSHVITGDYEPMGFGGAGSVKRLMRPQDVFKTMQGRLLKDAKVFDTRTTMAGGAVKSRRNNSLAPTYLSRVMNAWKSTYAGEEVSDTTSNTMGQLLANAAGQVREQMSSQDHFLGMLQRQTNFSSQQCATYKELVALSPNLDNVTFVSFDQGHSLIPNHQRGQTEHWHGSGMETVAATIVMQAVPAIMIDLLLTKLSIMVTNQTIGGDYSVQVMDAKTFVEGLDLTPYISRFINRLQVEVLRDLTRNNQIEIAFQLNIDIMGQSDISIGVNGQPMVPFAMPSFCDGMFVPVITNDAMTLNALASDIDTLCDNVNVDYSPNSNYDNTINTNIFSNGV
jgi:hypothetical protein